MSLSKNEEHHGNPSWSLRLTSFVFLALCLETLFSVPYRTLHLATHSAVRAWIAGLLGLVLSGVVYAMRRRVGNFATRCMSLLPSGRASLLLALTVGLLLRMLWILRFHPPLASDGAGYFDEATDLAQRHFYAGAFWPPGFPLFLTPFVALFGAHYFVAALCGFLLFAATLILTCRVTLQMTASHRAAAFSGWLLALWPGYITIVGINSKEALLAFLLTMIMGLLYFTREGQGSRVWLALVAIGLLSGFAALTQPGMLLFPAVILVAEWLLTKQFSAALLRTIVAGCAMIAAIAPWTARNYIELGRFIPISSNGGSVFYRANNPNANASYSAEGQVLLPKDEITADREGNRMAVEWITHHPAAFAKLAIRKQVVFLGDDGDGVYEGLKRNQSPSPLLYGVLKGVTSLYWFLLWLGLLCCCPALFRAPRWPIWFGVAFLPFLYQWMIDFIFESGSRHHFAHVSCLAVLTAAAFGTWSSTVEAPLKQ